MQILYFSYEIQLNFNNLFIIAMITNDAIAFIYPTFKKSLHVVFKFENENRFRSDLSASFSVMHMI